MPKMSPQIDRVTHSAEIGCDMLRIRDYLQKYFTEYPKDDPRGLGQFRLEPNRPSSYYLEIILKYREGKLIVVDGTNRLMRHPLEGHDSFEAFTGYVKGEPALMADWNMVRHLRNLWRVESRPAYRNYIFWTVYQIMVTSHDSPQVVREVWVDYGRFPDVIAAGQRLLSV